MCLPTSSASADVLSRVAPNTLTTAVVPARGDGTIFHSREPRLVIIYAVPPEKQKARDERDRVLYNLKPGERDRLREAQGGIDPITGDPLVPHANLDHDHRNGLVRGLLNPITNKFLVDDRDKLLAMLRYIENPPAVAALGPVYGLMGKAKIKKVMKYGPDGSKTPQARTS